MSMTAPYWYLLMKASIWRALMGIGMRLHHFASPKPPSPAFKVRVPSRISKNGGSFKLYFYLPEGYLDSPDGQLWPVVINYHGGGFTLGTGTDDARWAAFVTEHAKAVVVSVAYRLAPKYPFSIGIEDGTDAVIYIAAHAEELRIDPHRIALSGFSAGGNFALTVPLMLYDLQHDAGKRELCAEPRLTPAPSATPSREDLHLNVIEPAKSASTLSLPQKPLLPTTLELQSQIPPLTLRALIAFYPPVDFRISREEKRKTNSKPELNIPHVLSNLFDQSYLNQERASVDPPLSMSDPYLSPMAAEASQLSAAYPDDIILYTTEYDMLNAEGIAFGDRLKAEPINKTVKGGVILGVSHGFDRKPNPIRFPKEAEKAYMEACLELSDIFYGPGAVLVTPPSHEASEHANGKAVSTSSEPLSSISASSEEAVVETDAITELDGKPQSLKGKKRVESDRLVEARRELEQIRAIDRFEDSKDGIPIPGPLPEKERRRSLSGALAGVSPARVVSEAI